MATFFPLINANGVITQRPYGSLHSYLTTVVEQPCGVRYTWGWRGCGLTGFPSDPLGKFDLNYSAITDDEVEVLRDFFNSMRGRYGEFAFIDPSGNLVSYSEDFANASWSGVGVGGSTTDPFGGTRARIITGAGTLTTTVLSTSGATGYVLCGSVWVKADGTVLITVAGSSQSFSVTSASWRRLDHAATCSGGTVQMSISVPGACELFGAQCVASAGPGGYMRTPGNRGLHPKCRFDTDEFAPVYSGPGQNTLRLPIVEYN